MKVAQLTIEMAASVARLEKDMNMARRSVDNAMSKIRNSANMAMRALGALGLGLSVNALNNFVRGAINAGDEMSKMAQRIGVSTDAVAGLQLAFKQGGVASGEMQSSLSRLTKAMADGNDGLKRLGVTSGDTVGALQQISDQFQAMPDGAQKTALAVEIFGRSGAALIPILNQGSQSLRDYDSIARQLGITVDTETGKAFEKFNDTVDLLGQSVAGIANTLAAELLPRLQAAADTLLEFMMSLDIKKIAQTTIDILTVLSILVAGRVVAGFAALGKMLITTTGSMTAMNVAAGVLRGTLALLGGPVGALAAAAGLLYTFRTELGLTSKTVYDSKDSIDALKESVNQLSVAQTNLKINEVWDDLLTVNKTIADTTIELERAKNQLEVLTQTTDPFVQASIGSFDKVNNKIIQLTAALELATERGISLQEALQMLGARASGAAPQVQKVTESIEKAGKATKDTVGELRKLIEQYKFETEMLTKSEAEKEYAIFLRKLETDGVKEGTAAYKELTEAKIEAMQDRQFTQAVIRQAEEQKKSYQKQIDDRLKLEEEYAREVEQIQNQIGQSLTDALMNGGMKARDFLINMFKTLVLRPILQPILTGVTGAVMSAIGMPAAAGQGGAASTLGIIGSLKSAYDVISGGFAAVGSAATSLSAGLMGANSAASAFIAGTGEASLAAMTQLQSINATAAMVGSAATVLAGVAAGIGLGTMASGQFSVAGNQMVSTGIGTAGGAIVGGLMGGPVGAAIGAAIGGALGGVVNRMFGMGGRTTENAGYLVSLQAMGAEVQQFEDWKRKGGWFRGDQTGRNITEAAQEVNEFFNNSARAIGMSVQAMAQAVGVSTERIGEFAQDVIISTKGFTEAEFAQQVESYLMGLETSLVDFLIPAIFEFGTAADKTAADVLKRLTSSLMTVNQAFEVLGYSLYEMSLQGGSAASKLVDLFGGLEGFTAATSFYYENFYSAQEKVNFQTEQLTKIFGSLGFVMPSTNDAFRALVETAQAAGDDLLFANLLQLAPAFNSLQQALESLGETAKDTTSILREREQLETRLLQVMGNTAALRARELASVDESNRSLLESIYSVEDARSNLDRAMATLERSVAAERMAALKTLDANHKALMESLDGQLRSVQATQQVAREIVSTLGSLFGYISGQVQSLNQEINGARSASEGMAFIARALTTAQRTGYLPTQEDLSAAVSAARGGLTPENFATSFEMRRAQAQLSSRLTLLGRLTEGQLTIAEKQLVSADKSLDALRERIEQAQILYAAEVDRTNAYYDQILEQAQQQIDVLRGIDTGILSVAEAIAQLNIAAQTERRVTTQMSAPVSGGGSTIGVLSDARTDAVAQMYYDILGRAPDVEGLAFWTSAGITLDQIQKEIAESPEALGLSGFANGGMYPGGMAMVGERGPELINFDRPGMVYTNSQLRDAMGGDTAAEVRQLREENRAQSRAMVTLQTRMTRLLEQWDGDGLPESRMVEA